MNITKVVIPVAGWGTRSIPASKSVPKEMLPVYDKPVIQYVVEEAVAAGLRDVVFVTSRQKRVIEDHFDRNPLLEQTLERAGKPALLEKARAVADMVNVMSVRQKEQKGLGHAVLCARGICGRDDAFAASVGDDLMIGEGAGLPQLVEVAGRTGLPCIGVTEVPADKVNRYGIAMGTEIGPGIMRVTDLVEKPEIGTVTSRMAIVGRYVLTPDVFDCLGRTAPGKGGEIQLTDALAELSRRRGLLAVTMRGIRFDAGDWTDYLAANVYFGLRDPALHGPLRERIAAMVR